MKQRIEYKNSEKVKSLEYFTNQSVELSLISCGYENCDDQHHFRAYGKNYYTLYVVLKGDVLCRIEDIEYDLETGEGIIVYPGEKCYFESSRKMPWSYGWMGFTGVKAEACVLHSGFSQEQRICKIEFTDEIIKLSEEMMAVRSISFVNSLRRNGLLQMFFATLISQRNCQKIETKEVAMHRETVPEYIRNAISYISENYMHKVKINEMADQVGVNRSYFATSFKKAAGCSPKEYLVKLRMENAQLLLEKTELPINAVANAVGYSDQLAFSRIFKKYCGISPTEYRENSSK